MSSNASSSPAGIDIAAADVNGPLVLLLGGAARLAVAASLCLVVGLTRSLDDGHQYEPPTSRDRFSGQLSSLRGRSPGTDTAGAAGDSARGEKRDGHHKDGIAPEPGSCQLVLVGSFSSFVQADHDLGE